MTTTTMVPAKPWWKSKVIILNLLAIVGLVLTEVLRTPDLPVGLTRWLGVALGAINVVMRTFTVQPVAGSSDQVKEVPR